MRVHPDPVDYWRQRLRGRGDVGVVGHRSFGVAYNAVLYRRRCELLQQVLQSRGGATASSRVWEIGCGGGFWVEQWHQRGVERLVGIDLSADRIADLAHRFPDFEFRCADATAPVPAWDVDESFDVVTAFDVLYHIVEDERLALVLERVERQLRPTGCFLAFDQLVGQDYRLLPHVKFRGRATFLAMLERAGLILAERHPVFVVSTPPVFGRRVVDILVHGAYKVVGTLTRWDGLGAAAGALMYAVDDRLRRRDLVLPNLELLVIRPRRGTSRAGPGT